MDSAAEPVNVPTEDMADFERRTDGWLSLLKGIGVRGRDPVRSERPLIPAITDDDLEQIYRGNAIAARIVDLLPAEALREGWSVRIDAMEEAEGEGDEEAEGDDAGRDAFATSVPSGIERAKQRAKELPTPKPETSDVDPQEANRIADALKEYLRKLSMPQHTMRGFSLGRLFGGALVIGGFSDTGPDLAGLAKPLPEKGVELRWVILHDRRVAQPGPLEDNPESPDFGKPRSYEVTILDGTKTVTVHASRVLRFPGRWSPARWAKETGNRDPTLHGWDDSVLLGCWDAIGHFGMTHETTARVARDFSRIAYRMKGLHAMIAANREDLVRKRIELIELCQSVLNAMLLDADNESVEIMQRPVTGLPELLDRFGNLLAACSSFPITLLLGLSPGGFGTGEDEDRRWGNVVQAFRDEVARPLLERLVGWAFADPKGPTKGKIPAKWSITFPQVRAPSEKEKAEIRKMIAEAWAALVTAKVILPDEAAEGMFGRGDGFGMDIVLDREARVEAKELEAEQLENETEAMLAAARQPQGPAAGGRPPAPGGRPPPRPAAPQRARNEADGDSDGEG